MHRYAAAISTRRTCFAVLVTSALGSVTFPQVAFAGQSDVRAVFETLQRFEEQRGRTLTYENISESGDTVILTGIVRDVKGGKSQGPDLQVDTLAITGSNYVEGEVFEYETAVANGVTVALANKKGTRSSSGGLTIPEIVSGAVKLEFGSSSSNRVQRFSLESMVAKNIVLDATEKRTGTPTDTNYNGQIPSLSISGLDWNGKNDVSLRGAQIAPFTFAYKDKDQAFSLNSEQISLEAFSRFGKTGFDLGQLTVGNVTGEGVNENNMSFDVNFAGATLSDIFYPDMGSNNFTLPEKEAAIELKGLQVLLDEKPVFSWKGLTGTTGRTEQDGEIIRQQGVFDDVTINIRNFPGVEKNQRFQLLEKAGLDELILNLTSDGTWNSNTGEARLDDTTLTLRDGFSFGFGMVIDNYTQQVAQAIVNATNLDENDPNLDQANAQMLAALAPVTLEEFTIRLEDRSLLDRIISLQAERTGQPEEQIAGIVGPMATLMLAPYGVPEFAAALTGELNKFMQGGKMITLKAVPPSPITIGEMMALITQVQSGQLTPPQLLDRFNLTVETSDG